MNGLMKPCTTGWCSITQQSIYPPIQGRLVEPEVVATSPYPIKSRVPVCCGFSSRKMVLAVPMHRDTGDALNVVSLLLDCASMGPPAGDAPAGFLYKREPSRCIGTWRQKLTFSSPSNARLRRIGRRHHRITMAVMWPPYGKCRTLDDREWARRRRR